MTMQEHHESSDAPEEPRPASASLRLVMYVFCGGALGTAGREALALALPWHGSGLPWAVLIVNLAGSFMLGFLLTALAHRRAEPSVRDFRTFAGTGVLGGFTTYSSFATDTATLLGNDLAMAILYGTISVSAGLVCGGIGVWLAGSTKPSAFVRRASS